MILFVFRYSVRKDINHFFSEMLIGFCKQKISKPYEISVEIRLTRFMLYPFRPQLNSPIALSYISCHVSRENLELYQDNRLVIVYVVPVSIF